MATKSQAYDHVAYEVPMPIAFVTSSAAPARFAAFTSLILKNMVAAIAPSVATNNSTFVMYSIRGTSTTTMNTITIGTATQSSVAYAGTYGLATNTIVSVTNLSLGTTTILAGDTIDFEFTGGDSVKLAVGIEAYIVPGANLTV